MNNASTRRRHAIELAAVSRANGFWAIDVELDHEDPASLCALGLARVAGGAVVGADRWLFRPPRLTGRWAPLHGLGPPLLAAAPPLGDAFPERCDRLATAPQLVAFNAAFERGVLRAVARALGLTLRLPPILCALEVVRATVPLARYRLIDVCEHFKIPLATPHEPRSDAIATASILLAIAQLKPGVDHAG